MSVLVSVLVLIGRLLDGLRRFLHLILLLVIFGFVIGALSESIPRVPARAALVIAPEGEIVEQLSGDPLARALEQAQGRGRSQTLLWDLTETIRAAAKDRRIEALVIGTDYMESAGQPTLEELARAIGEFRRSGKKVIAYGTAFLQDHYYLAAQADEVYLDPIGLVLIDGYDRYRLYFKQALDKLGVDVNVFRAGTFKSAMEIFTRTEMSPEERQESLSYLDALWGTYRQAVARARRIEPAAIERYANDLAEAAAAAGGDSAQVALRTGLVTALRSRQQVEQRLIELVGEDESTGSFEHVTHRDYLRVVRAEKKLRGDGQARIGVIVASGDILDGEQPPGTIGGESTARLIREARLDEDVRAVVLRIDSPGGSMFACEEIHRELQALKAAGKPLVASLGDLAASAGYYIAAPADEIWASPATLTGSIGVFAAVPTVNRALDKIGVSVDGVGTTELSGQLRLDRPLGEEARQLLQSGVEHAYELFLTRVAAGRNKTRAQVDAIAQGRVWPGTDAKRLGLVDHLGSLEEAVKAAARRAKLTDYEIEFIEPELSWAQELALQVKTRVLRVLFASDERARSLARVMRRLDPVQREIARWSRFDARNGIYAYCFCSVP